MADERDTVAETEEVAGDAVAIAEEAMEAAEEAQETAEVSAEAVVEEAAILEAMALRIAQLEEAITSHGHEHSHEEYALIEHEHAKPQEPGEEADMGEERIHPQKRTVLHRLPHWAL